MCFVFVSWDEADVVWVFLTSLTRLSHYTNFQLEISSHGKMEEEGGTRKERKHEKIKEKEKHKHKTKLTEFSRERETSLKRDWRYNMKRKHRF